MWKSLQFPHYMDKDILSLLNVVQVDKGGHKVNNVTQKELAFLQFFQRFVRENGRAPSMQDCCQAMKWDSKNTAYYYHKQLVSKGCLRRGPRGYWLANNRRSQAIKPNEDFKIPYFGRSHCGNASLVSEEPLEWFDVSRLFGPADETGIVQAEGNSMVGRGISHGDLVVFNRYKDPSHEAIVVILVDSIETSIKVYSEESDGVYFRPCNHDEEFESIDPAEHEVQIEGVVQRVIKPV